MTFLELLPIAWRNLWRNPRRTAITAMAMAMGMLMLAFVLSIMAGMQRNMIDQGTGLMLGHIQIHAEEYRPDRSIFDFIPGDGRALTERTRSDASVLGAAPRVITYGLISSGNKSVGAEILGVDRAAEAEVTTLQDKLTHGSLPAPRRKQIAVGRLAATTLGVGIGDEVVIITQAADGSMGNDLYTVSGVFRTGIDLVDGGSAFLSLDDAQELLSLAPQQVHEIALRATSPADAQAIAATLSDKVGGGIEVAPWQTLAPELSSWVAMSDSWLWIMYAIVFALAAIAVLNTMLMAVFERLRELGVLAAIGMQPSGIIALVVLEVAALAMVSLAVATLVGIPLLRYVVGTGIDLSGLTGGFSVSGVSVGPIIHGDWVWSEFALAGVLLVLCAAVAGLYPAVRAARVDPALLTRGEVR